MNSETFDYSLRSAILNGRCDSPIGEIGRMVGLDYVMLNMAISPNKIGDELSSKRLSAGTKIRELSRTAIVARSDEVLRTINKNFSLGDP